MDMIVKNTKARGLHVRSVDIWKGLGYSEHRVIKNLINTNKLDFEEFGVLHEENAKPKTGTIGLVMNQQLENKITQLYKKLINPQTNRDELNAIGARMAGLIAMRSAVVVARMEREKGIEWGDNGGFRNERF